MNHIKYTTKNRLKLLTVLSLGFLVGCIPSSRQNSPLFSIDLLPPVLKSAQNMGSRELHFLFNEKVEVSEHNTLITPSLPVSSVTAEGKQVILKLTAKQEIGKNYQIHMTVLDKVGNKLSFIYNFSGWNPELPSIIINEFNPKGSGKNPDCVELLVLEGGNTGGIILRIGTQSRYSGQFIFPAIKVKAGEYLVIHVKPEGTREEINELDDISLSGGLLATDTARDFWLKGGSGLPGNNGAITLFERLDGPVMDAVLWSNRQDEPESEKRGWTSEGYIFAKELGESSGWTAKEGNIPFPSEAIDSSRTTGTRSLSRASIPIDTNTNRDWHTVPNRSSSFGRPNTDKRYHP